MSFRAVSTVGVETTTETYEETVTDIEEHLGLLPGYLEAVPSRWSDYRPNRLFRSL